MKTKYIQPSMQVHLFSCKEVLLVQSEFIRPDSTDMFVGDEPVSAEDALTKDYFDFEWDE